MGWIIEHETERDEETGDPLVWSSVLGWVGDDDFDTFTDEERDKLSLPMNGSWTYVQWTVFE